MKESKASRAAIEARVEVRDKTLIELGREAELRQLIRTVKARRAKAGKMALVAAAATGVALTTGAVIMRRRRAKQGGEALPFGGQPDLPK